MDDSVTNPNIDRREHDQTASAKRVLNLEYDAGSLSTIKTGTPKTENYDIEGSTIYVGEAKLGTLTSSALWTIYKYNIVDLTAASGQVAIAAVWDNRATETYL